MKTIVTLEEIAQVLICFLGIYLLPISLSWWVWLLLFFLPDVSIAGYALGNRAGAVLYNVFHHKAIAVAVFAAGFLTHSVELQATGVILYAHSAFDRALGYGLKTFRSFHHTHLGFIGTAKQ